MGSDTAPALHTFVFADLAGFTALTEAHGDERAADLVGAFCTTVGELVTGRDASVVKTIGDAVMVRAGTAGVAVELGLEVVRASVRHGQPAVRVGMHTGPAVEREGDWFGATVNVAARVAGAAAGGEVLLTEATRAALGEPAPAALSDRGPRRFKNVAAPVTLYAAQPAEQAERWPIDPVCRMSVEPARAAGQLRHEGVEHTFCSLECAARFARAPQDYAAAI